MFSDGVSQSAVLPIAILASVVVIGGLLWAYYLPNIRKALRRRRRRNATASQNAGSSMTYKEYLR